MTAARFFRRERELPVVAEVAAPAAGCIRKATGRTRQTAGLARFLLVQPDIALVAFGCILLGRRAIEPHVARSAVIPILASVDSVPPGQTELTFCVSRVQRHETDGALSADRHSGLVSKIVFAALQAVCLHRLVRSLAHVAIDAAGLSSVRIVLSSRAVETTPARRVCRSQVFSCVTRDAVRAVSRALGPGRTTMTLCGAELARPSSRARCASGDVQCLAEVIRRTRFAPPSCHTSCSTAAGKTTRLPRMRLCPAKRA